MTMYFGCRRSDRDFLYEEEMNAAKMDNVLTDVRLALSREPGLPKVLNIFVTIVNIPILWEKFILYFTINVVYESKY